MNGWTITAGMGGAGVLAVAGPSALPSVDIESNGDQLDVLVTDGFFAWMRSGVPANGYGWHWAARIIERIGGGRM